MYMHNKDSRITFIRAGFCAYTFKLTFEVNTQVSLAKRPSMKPVRPKRSGDNEKFIKMQSNEILVDEKGAKLLFYIESSDVRSVV